MTTDKTPTRPPPRVTHAELQAELDRLRIAIVLVATALGPQLRPSLVDELNRLLATPDARGPSC